MKLTDFKALTFDCYGTLIDWESGMIAALEPLTRRVKQDLSRDQILRAHAECESTQQRWTPTKNYREVLAAVYRRLGERWGVDVSVDECRAYGCSVEAWSPFGDTVEALRYLEQHYRLVILSNVDHKSFAASAAKLGVTFAAIYTAEDIGSYKPDSRNFEYMLEQLAQLGIQREEILHTAESLFHDHEPAQKARLASCWIYRRHAQEGFGATMPPGSHPEIQFRFDSLGDLAAAHRAQQAASS